MNKLLSLLLCFFSLTKIAGQSTVGSYIKNNTKLVSSIDPADTDYNDLKDIGDAIGNANLVLLGEQDHGDAPAFLAKTRLIKYLAATKGFSVVVFESTFFGLVDGWEHVNLKQDSVRSFLLNNIFTNWTKCRQCSPLFDYLAETASNKKIDIAGIDDQSHGTYAAQNWANSFIGFMDSSHIQLQGQPAASVLFKRWRALAAAKGRQQMDSAFNLLISGLDSACILAKAKYGERNFWVQELKNRVAKSGQDMAYIDGQGFRSQAARDRQMADNLAWLIEYKYPGRKIIVWAASEHVAKKALNNETTNEFMMKPMGEVFTANPPEGIISYSLGFSSLRGRAGRLDEKHYNISKPKAASFESWVNESDAEYAFVDFKNLVNRGEEFYMMGDIYHTYAKADWANIFDGIFYIRDMYPCDEVK